MATYTELHTLVATGDITTLRHKIRVAIAIKANTIAKNEQATAEQKAWAVSALRSPQEFDSTILNYIIAEYNAAATSAISGATDEQVQTAVNAAVDTLLGA